jgi:hypothetical protein
MKMFAWATLGLVVAVGACGGGKKPAENAENGDDGGGGGDDASAASSTDLPPSLGSAPASSAAVGGDDTGKKNTPCGGFDIPDLLAVISQAACEVPAAPANAKQREVKDVLEIKAQPDSPLVAPGSNANITITFHNKGKGDLPLDFVVDPEPRFTFEVYTLKGSRADAPPGTQPPLPQEVANAHVPEAKTARVTLPQQGTAKLTIPWSAVKYKWASKDRARGAVPGHGYPVEANGPLPKGKYVLRVITPLTGIFEGVDHEVSQPRVQIAVGGI